MNGFGFLSLRYSVYELIAPHSVRVPLKILIFIPFSFPCLSCVLFSVSWNNSQFLRQLVKNYRLPKNHSIDEKQNGSSMAICNGGFSSESF